MKSFEIKSEVLHVIDEYHKKSLIMQEYLYENKHRHLDHEELKSVVDDDLIFHVPIYDMLDRRYAAFCSLLEALHRGPEDPKNNGMYFPGTVPFDQRDFASTLALFYLFRLCGSGINYVPKIYKIQLPFGTHGFGNFWICDSIVQGSYNWKEWLEQLSRRNTPFTDNKGYLLPQFSYDHLESGHLKYFILTELEGIIEKMQDLLGNGRISIISFVDQMNDYLVGKGFKKQNFVMSATAADIAEYFPNLIDPKSSIYAGTNAKKCIASMFKKSRGVKQLNFEIEAIEFLAERYDSVPYSVEDSRLCDIYRYLYEFQSKYHIQLNGGRVYKNNCSIKAYCEMSGENYEEYIKKLLN